MKNGILFNVSNYEANLWKYRKLVDQDVATRERLGESQTKGFRGFAQDVFHQMFSDSVSRKEEAPVGSDVFVKLHEQASLLPEISDLADRCTGDETLAGIGTAAVIDSLLTSLPTCGVGVDDIAGDGEAKDMLEKLLAAGSVDAEDVEEIQKSISELSESVERNKAEAVEAAERMDDTEIRGALRVAADAAKEACDEQDALVDGFMAGSGRGTSRSQRAGVARKLARVTANREAIKKVALIAGRLRRIAMNQQDKKPAHGTDEIAGIEMGRSLERIVSAEWALCDDEDLEGLFMARYTEGSLAQLEVSAKEVEGQGPIVICIDCSGSMYGANETWAGACLLAFIEIATRQKRNLSAIYFDSGVRRVEHFPVGPRDIDQVLSAVLLESAGGGTSWMAPLTAAADLIQEGGTMKNADVILITDGACSVSDSWLAAYNETAAAVPFSTYSILIGCRGSKAADCFSEETINLADVMSDEGVAELFGKI